MSYIQLTTPLILHADPTQPNHAVTKRYVDNKRNNLNALAFTQGILDVARLPGFIGAVTSQAGTNELVLSDSGVAPGTYSRVTVSSDGRVIEGGTLTAADITSVDWSKITTGKPTTLVGYGITNVLPLTGGTVTGPIFSTAVPTDPLHAVTKAYVDSVVTGVASEGLSAGDVIRKPISSSPSGFLRCNGGEVPKATYPALYAVVGDRYNQSTLRAGAGVPSRNLTGIDTAESTVLGPWKHHGLPARCSDGSFLVVGPRVYAFFYRETVDGNISVFWTTHDVNGLLGEWTRVNGCAVQGDVFIDNNNEGTRPGYLHMTDPYYDAAANRIYIRKRSSVSYTSVGSQGEIGPWTTVEDTATLPSPWTFGEVKVPVIEYVMGPKLYRMETTFKNYSDATACFVGTLDADKRVTAWVRDDSHMLNFRASGDNGDAYLSPAAVKIQEGNTLTVLSFEYKIELTYNASGNVVFQDVERVTAMEGETQQGAFLHGGYVYLPFTYSSSYGGGYFPTAIPRASNPSGNSVVLTEDTPTFRGFSPLVIGDKVHLIGCPFQAKNHDVESPSTRVETLQVLPDKKIVRYTADNMTSASTKIFHGQTVVTKNKVYLLNAMDARRSSFVVYKAYVADINPDGSVTKWQPKDVGPGNSDMAWGNTITTKSRVYFFGVYQYVSHCFWLNIDSQGTLDLTVRGYELIHPHYYFPALFITKDWVYMAGGEERKDNFNSSDMYPTGLTYNKVWKAPVDSAGVIGAWTETLPLLYNVSRASVVVTSTRVYLIGGRLANTGGSIFNSKKVQWANINPDGSLGTWTAGTDLPTAFQFGSVLVTKNRVYIMGGSSGEQHTLLSTVHSATISWDGILGDWELKEPLPAGNNAGALFVTKNKVHLMGLENTAWSVYASINAGENDYMPYFTNNTLSNDPLKFRLPDFSNKELEGVNYFVKY